MKVTSRDFAFQSDLHPGLAIMRDWALILGLIVLSEWLASWWLTAFCVVGIGMFQFALGEALLHEASHYKLFRVRGWNDRLELFYALPFLTTVDAYRAEHLDHHRRLGKESDHIVQDYAFHGLTSDTPRTGWVWFGKPILGLTAIGYVRTLWNMNPARTWLKVAIFWVPVVAICTAAGLLPELLLYWFVPLLAIYATLLHWSEIADHYRTRTGTRSRTGRIYNWIWRNNGFHAIHHQHPMLPFHNLARAHRALGGERWDSTGGWWGVWRQISRPPEQVPEKWAGFWPRLEAEHAAHSPKATAQARGQ